jgi:hypothetical protein
VYMGTGAPFTFKILKISKSHTFVSLKIMALKYIGRYLHEKYMQKSSVKNMLYFEKYKNDKFLIVNSCKAVVKYYISLSEICLFLYFS